MDFCHKTNIVSLLSTSNEQEMRISKSITHGKGKIVPESQTLLRVSDHMLTHISNISLCSEELEKHDQALNRES